MDAISYIRANLSKTMVETTYLLRSPANAHNILESIADLEADNAIGNELIK